VSEGWIAASLISDRLGVLLGDADWSREVVHLKKTIQESRHAGVLAAVSGVALTVIEAVIARCRANWDPP
jgi:hypothetical protein